MYSFIVLLIVFTTNVMSWEGYHTEFDDDLPSISPKYCGITNRMCGPNFTFDDPFVSSRIRNGEFAEKDEYPFFLTLERDHPKLKDGKRTTEPGHCGSAIINEWWVVTAAHCVDDIRFEEIPGIKPTFLLIGNGRKDFRITYRYEVEKVVIHNNYNIYVKSRMKFKARIDDLKQQFREWEVQTGKPLEEMPDIEKLNEEYKGTQLRIGIYEMQTYQWDIALMKVRQRIVPIFNESHYIVNSFCLPKYGIINSQNESMVIMGMGLTHKSGHGGFSDRLKKGMTQMLTRETCDKVMEKFMEKYLYKTYQICGSVVEDANTSLTRATTCPGDSGSPTIQYKDGCKAVLVGIASHATGAKDLCFADMMWWTRVSLFMPWIRLIVKHPNLPANYVTYGKSYGSESFSDDSTVSKPLILFTNLFVLSAVVLILVTVWLLAIVLVNSKNP